MGSGIIDWFPSSKVEDRINLLDRYGVMGVNWKTTTGILRTAEILWNAKDDEEKLAMTWISASLNEVLDFFPEAWREIGAYSSIMNVKISFKVK